jgi:hypothetical protein
MVQLLSKTPMVEMLGGEIADYVPTGPRSHFDLTLRSSFKLTAFEVKATMQQTDHSCCTRTRFST